jgi:hypothetical protein
MGTWLSQKFHHCQAAIACRENIEITSKTGIENEPGNQPHLSARLLEL